MRTLAMVAALAAGGAAAQDFSAGSEAREWGLTGEAKARFEAVVTDPLCALAGDCAPDCGGGRRQLVLVRTADDVMLFPNKNAQPVFTGAARELAPFCGERVEVDGLTIDNPDTGATNIYLVQRIRPTGGEWRAADRWTEAWAQEHPDAAGDGPWFRRDPRVAAELAAEGWLGLGADSPVEEAFLEDWLQ